MAAAKSRPATSVVAIPAARSAASIAASTAGSTSGVGLRPHPGHPQLARPGREARFDQAHAEFGCGHVRAEQAHSVQRRCQRVHALHRTRPQVVFRPTTPQQAAGIRTEPPPSVPSATSASPQATATAEPLDEPPGSRRGSSGFTGVPDQAFVPAADQHSSDRLVLPTILAPDRRAAATTAASRCGRAGALGDFRAAERGGQPRDVDAVLDRQPHARAGRVQPHDPGRTAGIVGGAYAGAVRRGPASFRSFLARQRMGLRERAMNGAFSLSAGG